MTRPRLLDLFCCAGGAGMGYHRAGFDVVGVDIKPQPRYPFPFILGDALDVLRRMLAGEKFLATDGNYYGIDDFGAIHASPPCQGYSRMRHVTGKEYPLMIDDVRAALRATGKPYIIENVEDAPLIDDILLCGTMFGLKTFRHRKFETSFFMMAPPHITHTLFGKASAQGRPVTEERQYITVTGNFSGIETGKRAMGIDWMNKRELTQAIPPAYTEYIGRHLMEVLL